MVGIFAKAFQVDDELEQAREFRSSRINEWGIPHPVEVWMQKCIAYLESHLSHSEADGQTKRLRRPPPIHSPSRSQPRTTRSYRSVRLRSTHKTPKPAHMTAPICPIRASGRSRPQCSVQERSTKKQATPVSGASGSQV